MLSSLRSCIRENRELGLIVSLRSALAKGAGRGKHEFNPEPMASASSRGLKVIGSSEQVHVVDALAITGDEGRGSLR